MARYARVTPDTPAVSTPLPPLIDPHALDAQIGVRLPVELLARLDRYLARLRTTHAGATLTRSDVFRDLLELGLRSESIGPRQQSLASIRRAQVAYEALPELARTGLVRAMRRIPVVDTMEDRSHLRRPASDDGAPRKGGLILARSMRPAGRLTGRLERPASLDGIDAQGDDGPRLTPTYATVDHLTGQLVVVPEAAPDSRTWLERARALNAGTRLPDGPAPDEDVTARPMGSTMGHGARPRTNHDR